MTGPKSNWLVEWESEGNSVSAAEADHAEREVFENPGGMKLELGGGRKKDKCSVQ